MNKSLVDLDAWLEPYKAVILRRQNYIKGKSKQLLGTSSVSEFALGHLYFGLHRTKTGWVFREWAPHATSIFLVGDMNNWDDTPDYELHRTQNGVWELELTEKALHHLERYKLHIHWPGGSGYRIPAYATYVVQNEETRGFDAVIWQPPQQYKWHDTDFTAPEGPPLIYEAHVGMSSEQPEVASYQYFTKHVLPRIARSGYNTVQLMAVQEHPYYGSFGYHVSNFFAASSRFGTPDDLKHLVDTAHRLGLRIILDIVHSHSVRNEEEGLSRFDGTLTQYFYPGERGVHELWDSRVFDYGKSDVQHFLLSNLRFWLDEYHFDGFRFDGVTSMLYTHHGLAKDFLEYADYYKNDVDLDALTYLTLTNRLVNEIKPEAITVAEEMSGFPGIAGPLEYGGQGFKYRLSMGVPDLWIKTLKEKTDEEWQLSHLFHELSTHRAEERVISYAESHDQALVGDQTLLFRLLERDIYTHMHIDDKHLNTERGIALHKLIRLITASLNSGGYLNFMGNEFGHPEWIDFPREGNHWSFHYARRQWSLADDPALKFHQLGAFDVAMLQIVKQLTSPTEYVYIHDADGILSFMRNGYLFAFNFSPEHSYTGYAVPAPAGSYSLALSSDASDFGGQGRVDDNIEYLTHPEQAGAVVKLYLPARTAIVLRQQK
jgi:1,4-alpha-glucan branching enzyme